jgi:hypothetical protein
MKGCKVCGWSKEAHIPHIRKYLNEHLRPNDKLVCEKFTR